MTTLIKVYDNEDCDYSYEQYFLVNITKEEICRLQKQKIRYSDFLPDGFTESLSHFYSFICLPEPGESRLSIPIEEISALIENPCRSMLMVFRKKPRFPLSR